MSSPSNTWPAQADEINIMEAAIKQVTLVRKHLTWLILFPILGIFGGFLNNLVQGSV